MRRYLASVAPASTVRAGVYLVVGGVLASAYLTLVAGFVQMLAAPVPRAVVIVLAAVTLVVVTAPFFLTPVRTLQIHAVRTLLDVAPADLPDPHARTDAATRWRGAAWFALHLLTGATATIALLVVVPLATALVLSALGADDTVAVQVVPHWNLPPLVAVPVALVGIATLPLLVAVLRSVLRQAAAPLLGPDQAARIAELERRAARLADRNRIARELHDSVGHALTVTTLQAAAAARRLDTDVQAARESLAAIEETGRAAMADLDHVVGLLRADDDAPVPTAPTPTLEDLPALLDDARRAGLDLRHEIDTAPGDVPRVTSAEAYRIVQEALTNALRHAPDSTVHVTVTVARARQMEIEVTSTGGRPAVASRTARAGAGHGLVGMADRVRLLGGRLTAGPDDGGSWVVRARLPLATPGR
jgi:signal transduction histidine kinase